MRNQNTIIVILLAIFALNGCQESYKSTLDHKLVNKSPEEKRILLNQECVSILEKHKKYGNNSSSKYVEQMKNICQEMTGQKKLIKK